MLLPLLSLAIITAAAATSSCTPLLPAGDASTLAVATSSLHGEGCVIDGFGLNKRLVRVAAAGVALSNISFIRGSPPAGHGGGVLFEHSGTIDSCRFCSNSAESPHEGNYDLKQRNGGGLAFVAGVSCSSTACEFRDNRAQNGAGVYAFQASGVSAWTTTDITTGHFLFDRSTWHNNVAPERGGGLTVYSSVLDIHACTFSTNKAPGGGAIRLHQRAAASCKNSTFLQNRGTEEAGSIYYKISELRLEHVEFRAASDGNGFNDELGINTYHGLSTFTATTFTARYRNHVYMNSASTAYMSRCVFKGLNTGSYLNGGLVATSNTRLDVASCTFGANAKGIAYYDKSWGSLLLCVFKAVGSTTWHPSNLQAYGGSRVSVAGCAFSAFGHVEADGESTMLELGWPEDTNPTSSVTWSIGSSVVLMKGCPGGQSGRRNMVTEVSGSGVPRVGLGTTPWPHTETCDAHQVPPTMCCEDCAAGTFALPGSLDCRSCPAGTYSSSAASICKTCTSGFFSFGSASVCTLCFPGRQSSTSGARACENCVPGRFASTNRTSCQDCAPGRSSATGMACTPCFAGRVAPSFASPDCSDCALGMSFQDSTGASVCKTCTACVPGTARIGAPSLQQNHQCASCVAGTFSNTTNADKCVACELGWTFQDDVSATVCKACTSCVPGTARVGTPTLQQNHQCSSCVAGTFSNTTNADKCVACELGWTFQDDVSATVCKACTSCVPGKARVGAPTLQQNHQCSSCVAGTFSNTTNADKCVACALGWTFQDDVSATVCKACTSCVPGKARVGAPTLQQNHQCSSCVAGTFSNMTNADKCVACALGWTFQDNVSATVCKACTSCVPGKARVGAPTLQQNHQCSSCVAGTYSTNTNEDFCGVCPAGKFQDQVGKDECNTCQACAPGEWAAVACSSLMDAMCRQCPAGTFSQTSHALACDECEPGYFCTGGVKHTCGAANAFCRAGAVTPTKVDPGFYSVGDGGGGGDGDGVGNSEEKGQTDQRPCPAGFICLNGTRRACHEVWCPKLSTMPSKCPLGFAPERNGTACFRCPKHVRCDDGSLALPAGFWRVEDASEPVHGTTKFFGCMNPDFCLANMSCQWGHRGKLCGLCNGSSWVMSGGGCAPCPSPATSITYVCLAGLGMTLAIFYIIKTTGPKRSNASITFRVFINYAVVMATLGSFRQKLPAMYRRYFVRAMNVVTFAFSLDSHAIGCVVNMEYTQRFYAQMAIPIFILIVPALILFAVKQLIDLSNDDDEGNSNTSLAAQEAGQVQPQSARPPRPRSMLRLSVTSSVRGVLKRKLSSSTSNLRDTYSGIVVLLLFVVYPSVSKIALSTFRCYHESVQGVVILFNHADTVCRDPLRWIVGGMGIAAWAIGIPTVALAILWRKRGQLHDPHVKKAWGFVYAGFEHKYWAWEFVVLGRKLMVIAVSAFFQDPTAASFFVAIGLIFFLVAHVAFMPYEKVMFDRLETVSLGAAVLTQLFTTMYSSYDDGSYDDIFTGILIFVNLSCLFCFFAVGGYSVLAGPCRRFFAKRQAAKVVPTTTTATTSAADEGDGAAGPKTMAVPVAGGGGGRMKHIRRQSTVEIRRVSRQHLSDEHHAAVIMHEDRLVHAKSQNQLRLLEEKSAELGAHKRLLKELRHRTRGKDLDLILADLPRKQHEDDGDDTAAFADVAQLFEKLLKRQLDQDAVHLSLERCDRNGDGLISICELRRILALPAAPAGSTVVVAPRNPGGEDHPSSG